MQHNRLLDCFLLETLSLAHIAYYPRALHYSAREYDIQSKVHQTESATAREKSTREVLVWHEYILSLQTPENAVAPVYRYRQSLCLNS